MGFRRLALVAVLVLATGATARAAPRPGAGTAPGRKALPAGSLLSWYVWRQDGYRDVLADHPEIWASTTAAACRS
jgi:hypothetical protein